MNRRDVLKSAGASTLLGAASCVATPTTSAEPDIEAAFHYAFPLYQFARFTLLNGRPSNTFNRNERLADHTDRTITSPNNDTIYCGAKLDLSVGPIEVISPTDTRRYFSLAFLDAFTDNFAYIGTRATEGKGGGFWVVGPHWSGSAPAGVQLLRSSTNDAIMSGRILVDGPEDLAAAGALAQQIMVNVVGGGRPAPPFPIVAPGVEDPENFLGVVNEVLARSPGRKGQTARAVRFAKLGIGEKRSVTPEVLRLWKDYLPGAMAALREAALAPAASIDGWTYPEPGYGNFGTNDRFRSIVSLRGYGALSEKEAMYFGANADAAGAPMLGDHAYRWRVPPSGVPADAFWSLTMYQLEPDGRSFFVDNPIRRYAIGDRTKGLVKNADGSIDILMQRNQPAGPLAANWLPAPAGSMRPLLRAYIPGKELLDRKWSVPPIERVG